MSNPDRLPDPDGRPAALPLGRRIPSAVHVKALCHANVVQVDDLVRPRVRPKAAGR